MDVNKKININFSVPGGILGALTITFVVLKALGYLDWAWLWVFSPLWIPLAVVVAILLAAILIALIGSWIDEPWWRRG